MAAVIEAAVLGLYLPIIVCSGMAFWLFVRRLFLPAWREGRLTVARYAIGISAALSLLAHMLENVWYGSSRWTGAHWMNEQLAVVGIWKVIILASCVAAIAFLNGDDKNEAEVRRVAWGVATLWVAGTLAALLR